jgi:mRNA-degrading endonuclease RelE of RelBE toxin-antitoxin system
MSFKIEASSTFEKELKKLSKKYPSIKEDVIKLQTDLEQNPILGTSIGKHCYKIRLAIKSKGQGKSGGARVITCVVSVRETVVLLSIYDKSEKEDISGRSRSASLRFGLPLSKKPVQIGSFLFISHIHYFKIDTVSYLTHGFNRVKLFFRFFNLRFHILSIPGVF